MQNFAYLYDLHFASTKYRITMVEHKRDKSDDTNYVEISYIK